MKKLILTVVCLTMLCSCDYVKINYVVIEKAKSYCKENNSDLYEIGILEDSKTFYDVSCSNRNVPTKRFEASEI